MPGRTFAQIECSLTGSRRMRGLSDHKTRWAYMCAHLSDFATYSGMFRYPRHMWAHDAVLTMEELDAAIAELVEAGLIQFDPDEEIVRIVGWFHKQSGPDNRNRVVSVIGDFSAGEDYPPDMFCNAVAELAVASIKRALKWKENSTARDQLVADLRTFLADVFSDYGDELLACLRAELEGTPGSVQTEIGAIFPPVLLCEAEPFPNPSDTVAEHETKTRRDLDETKTQTKTRQDEDVFLRVSKLRNDHPSEPIPISEALRNREGPSPSALNSKMARAARGVS